MKLLTFEKDGVLRMGVSVDEGVIDFSAALALTNPNLGLDSVLSVIQSGVDVDTIGGACLSQLRSSGRLGEFLVSDFSWKPPILKPSKILALALNYQEHIDETNLHFYNEPIVFEKYPSNMIANGDDIELPPFPQKVDEEIELALVVGRECRHIRPSEAADYIFGFTICNDVSARNRQRERMEMGQPYSYAKNFATFCPMGPWIVTMKELPNHANLDMEVRVNGAVTRKGNSSQMIFSAYETLAYCSDYTFMEPGDVISLGTFAGDKELHDGDDLELEIEGIGVLRNRVTQSTTPWRSFTLEERTGPMVREE